MTQMAKWARCPECNKEFPKRGNQKFCQEACRRKQEKIRKTGLPILKRTIELPEG